METVKTADFLRIFAACADLPSDARHTLLQAECSERPEMQQLIERALSNSAAIEHDTLLRDGGLIKWTEQLLADDQESADQIGRYRVLSVLSRGGMGTVLLAVRSDLQNTGLVALKVINRGLDRGAFLTAFNREREILASLKSHPNIVHLEDADVTKTGVPYLIMEYIDGLPLNEYCEKNEITVEDRLKLFLTVCEAVSFAHQRAIIHRDLKPNNVLVTTSGIPKLLDFGIAKLLATSEDEASVSIVEQKRIMTIEYASPEQVRGELLDVRTDVYSLGVVLYRLLTGVLPYDLNLESAPLREKAVCEEEPRLPSLAVQSKGDSSKDLQRQLTGDLDNILCKALRKRADERYASVDQFGEDIQRHLRHEPVRARPNTWAYSTGRFIRRHRLPVLTGAAFIALLFVSFVLISWQAHVASLQRERAERRFNDVRQLANSFLFEFDKAIQDVPGTTAAQQLVALRAREYLDSLAHESSDPQLTRELAISYVRVGDVEGDPFGQSLGEPEAALESYKKSRDLRARLPVTVDSEYELAESHMKIADILWLQRKWKEATQNYSIARQLDEKALAIAPSRTDIRKQLSVVYTGLGDTAVEVEDLSSAKGYHQHSLEIRNALAVSGSADEQRSVAVGYIKLGDVANDMGDIPGAIMQYQAALRIFKDLATKAPHNQLYRSNMHATLERLGQAQLKNGQPKEAAASHKQALELATEAFRDDKTDAIAKRSVATAESQLGDDLMALGLHDEAVAHLRNHLRIEKELLAADETNGQTRRDSWIATFQLGKALIDYHKLSEARSMLEDSLQQALDLVNRSPGDTVPVDDLVDARVALAHAMRASSDWKGALEQLRLALPDAQKLAKDFSSNIDHLSRLAGLYSDLAKTHELAAKCLPAQADAQEQLAKEAWQQSLNVCISLDQKGLLNGMYRPLLAEAKRKAG